ncbi:MAG: MFS transporter [Syntrophorhabdales bacterium]
MKDGRYKWLVLLTVSVGDLIASLDVSVCTVCLPALASALKTGHAAIGWVNVIYLITSQSLMFSIARIGDARGRKRVYLFSLALYTAGLLFCSLSQNVTQLMLSRAIQGVGGAGVISLCAAIALAVFPEEEQGKAVGILASVGALGLVAGPIMGGAVLDLFGWRAVFFSRVPIGVAGMLMAWFVVKEQAESSTRFHFDLGGAFSLFGCLTCALLFLNFVEKWTFFSRPSLFLLMGAIVLLAIFLLFERRADQPIIELSLFRNPVLTGAAVTSVIHATVVAGSVFLLPFYLIDALGYSASMVGLLFALLAVPFLLLSPLAGRASDRMGHKLLSALGMALSCVALFYLGRLGSQPTIGAIVLCISLIGMSYGVFIAPNNSAIMKSVPKDRFGTASGIIATTRQVGASTGIAVVGGLFAGRIAFYSYCPRCLGPPVMNRIAVASAFRYVLTAAALFGILGIITAFIPIGRHAGLNSKAPPTPRRAHPLRDTHFASPTSRVPAAGDAAEPTKAN